MSDVIAVVSLVGFLVGLVAMVKGNVKWLHLGERKHGLALVVASFMLFVVGIGVTAPDDGQVDVAKNKSSPTPAPKKLSPKPTPTISPPESPSTSPIPSQKSVGSTLASLDEGRVIRADDPLVRQYDAVLDSLQVKCGNERARLGDMAVTTQRLMEEQEIQESLLSILVHVRQSISESFPRREDCAEVFGAYAFLRVGG